MVGGDPRVLQCRLGESVVVHAALKLLHLGVGSLGEFVERVVADPRLSESFGG